MYELIYTLRQSTIPLNEHTDPLSINDCWDELDDLITNLGTTFKDQLYTKEILEELIGKKIHKFEKVYDDDGILKEVRVQPLTVLEYIDSNFKILSSGEKLE